MYCIHNTARPTVRRPRPRAVRWNAAASGQQATKRATRTRRARGGIAIRLGARRAEARWAAAGAAGAFSSGTCLRSEIRLARTRLDGTTAAWTMTSRSRGLSLSLDTWQLKSDVSRQRRQQQPAALQARSYFGGNGSAKYPAQQLAGATRSRMCSVVSSAALGGMAAQARLLGLWQPTPVLALALALPCLPRPPM